MFDSRAFKSTVIVFLGFIVLGFCFGVYVDGKKQKQAKVAYHEAVANEARESTSIVQPIETPLQTQRITEPITYIQTMTATAQSDSLTQIEELKARIKYLERRIRVIDGPVRNWLATIRPTEQPDPQTLRTMAEYMASYPITLRLEDGLWLAERIEKDDWKQWGPTIDEAMVNYFGEDRLRRELTAEQFADLTQ